MLENIFMISFDNKHELISCSSFQPQTYGYIPENLNKYVPIKPREFFRSDTEYKKYLKTNNIEHAEIRYDYLNVASCNTVGTMLLSFLDLDFSDYRSITSLLTEYGTTSLTTQYSQILKVDFKQILNKFIEKEKYSSISETTLDNMSKVFLPLIQEDLVSAQDYFKELINFTFNLENQDFLNGLTPSQRYCIFDRVNRFSDFSSFPYMYETTAMYNIRFPNEVLMHIDDSKKYTLNELANLVKEKTKNNDSYKTACLTYNFKSLCNACYFTLLYLIEHNIHIKKCKNCGKYFIPETRNSSIYCNNIFENNKTCREIGASIQYNEKLKKDETNQLYRKTLASKKMLANRNPDIPEYLEKYEEWKKQANKFKQDIKNGLKTEEEFKEWIKQTK